MLFWLVVLSSAAVGIILLVAGNLLPAAAVLISGAILGVVLALLPRLADGGGILADRAGARRNAKAMLPVSLVFLAVGVVLWVIDVQPLSQILLMAGLGGTLGSVAMLTFTSEKAGDT